MDERPDRARGYWYAGSDQSVEVLRALRRFRAAENAMRSHLKLDMDLNETDLRALRQVIAAESTGRSISPTELTRTLGITSAATAKLLARLERSGHMRREQNPLDRRAQLLHPTASAHQEVRKTLSTMHERMLQVAEGLSAEERATVVRFLDAMGEAVDGNR